jgi:hypothetical protein
VKGKGKQIVIHDPMSRDCSESEYLPGDECSSEDDDEVQEIQTKFVANLDEAILDSPKEVPNLYEIEDEGPNHIGGTYLEKIECIYQFIWSLSCVQLSSVRNARKLVTIGPHVTEGMDSPRMLLRFQESMEELHQVHLTIAPLWDCTQNKRTRTTKVWFQNQCNIIANFLSLQNICVE